MAFAPGCSATETLTGVWLIDTPDGRATTTMSDRMRRNIEAIGGIPEEHLLRMFKYQAMKLHERAGG